MLVEPLEDRRMLAGDLDWGILWPAVDSGQLTTEPLSGVASSATAYDSPAEGESTPADDLVAFAKALTQAGVKYFTAAWCTACTAQKQLFADGGDFLPSIEVTNPDRTLNSTGVAEGITAFPTWQFPDGSREVGVLSLATISQRSGVAIPQGVDPFVAPIADQIVYFGSPLHIGLNGYDPNGGPLTFTVTSSNPSIVQPTVLTGNRSARVSVQDWGDMVFELFEDRVPRAAGRFITLAESGFYDAANNDPPITIHRVIDNFILQFGDPTGTGAGGSSLGNFDDQFHPDLQHNNPGGISWAKSTDDTNNSQVFVIDVPTRFLDYNHSYFGQLTEGDSVRNAITATATNASNRPIVPINIDSVTIFEDIENGVVMLRAMATTGQAEITVTVTDAEGNQYVETFSVTVAADPYNSGPYLEDIPVIQTTMNAPAVFTLSAIDVEGDPVLFDAVKSGSVNYTFTVDSQTGQVAVSPPTNFVGTMQLLVRVRPATSSDTSDLYDSQLVTIVVAPPAPATPDLLPASDTGVSDSDNVTNLTNLSFGISGVLDGALVRLYRGETVIGQATASGTTATITSNAFTALGDGTYQLVATQLAGGVESGVSGVLEVTIDTVPPPAFTSTPPSSGRVGRLLTYDAENPGEGASDALYSLLEPPSGAAIDALTGVMTWTPDASAVGINEFAILLTDAAGNARVQEMTINVLPAAVVGVRLEATTLTGTPITAIDMGESFRLNVYVEDLRDNPSGVFAAYLDIFYQSTLVQLNGTVTYGAEFPNLRTGNTSQAGLLDEIGGAAGFTPLGGGEFLLLSAPFVALAAGNVTFVADPADTPIFGDVLVFGSNTPVPVDEISYGSTVLSVLPPFTVNDDLFNVDEDSPATSLDVLANDEVHEGSSAELTIVAVGTPSHGGTVEIAQDGKSVWYTPAPDFFGEETFTYTASDGNGTRTANVTVQVAPVNDDPIAVDDQFTVSRGAVNVPLNVLANDSSGPDPGETLTIISFSGLSAGGLLSIPAEGNRLLYTPAPNFSGVETFTYTISDGHGGTAQATVTVTVSAENAPPAARDDLLTVTEDSVNNVLNVIANDVNQADPTQPLVITAVSTPEHGGTVTIAADGSHLIYTPTADFFGSERFTYTIRDHQGLTAQATVTVVVQAVNDPPTANNDSFSIIKDTSNNVLDVLANDSSEPDAPETLTIVAVGSSSAGSTVTIAADGRSLLYSPPAGFSGTDTFTYTIQDPGQLSAQATVTVTVLEYRPSALSGFVYLDVNNNGIKEATESGVGGVLITLSGTDVTGATVQQTRTTDATGYYQFTNLAPGSYRLVQTQPATLLDGIDSGGSFGSVAGNDELVVNLPENTQATHLNFGERGRKVEHISVLDFFASTPRDTVLVAAANQTSQWYAIEGGWSHAQSINVQVTGNGPAAVMLVTTTEAQEYSAPLNLQARDQVQPLGNAGSTELFRVVAPPAALFPNAPCACGEGEADSTILMAATPADAYQVADLLLAELATAGTIDRVDDWLGTTDGPDASSDVWTYSELVDEVLIEWF